MHRCVYRAQMNRGAGESAPAALRGNAGRLQEYLQNEEIMTLSVFRWERNLFAYYECMGRDIPPEELFGGLSAQLSEWPGQDEPRRWVPMADIYHACEPASAEWWKRKQPVKRAFATLNRLRPEMLSSYIFYHFQYQEEKPGDWAKYASIFLHENLMFFYQEDPDGPVVSPLRGRLTTANTPDGWQELMCRHFLPWEDDPEMKKPWMEIEQVLHVSSSPNLRI